MNRPFSLLVTDADNTLWDTDAVYAAAQLALLHTLETAVGKLLPATDRLSAVRALDQLLIERLEMEFTYEPRFLAAAAISVLEGDRPAAAVDKALGAKRARIPTPEVESAATEFTRAVTTSLPSLRKGVATTLPRISNAGIDIVVATEGARSRCEALLRHHNLFNFVKRIEVGEKTVQLFRSLIEAYPPGARGLMVGDQLERDILPAAQAGFATAHFPSGFQPRWSRPLSAQPDFQVETFEDVARIALPAERTEPTLGRSRPKDD